MMSEPYFRGYGFNRFSGVILYLILGNFVVFFFQLIASGFINNWFSLIPARVILRIELWRIFSYMFLHGDFAHIFFSMLALFFFGPALERTLGKKKFLFLYFLCGVLAGVISGFFYFLLGELEARIIGASGAIFGILAGYALYFPNSRVYLNFILPIKAKWMVLIFAGIELVATFNYAGGGRSGIASIAHLSGMVIAYFYLRRFSDLKRLWLKYKYRKLEKLRKQKFKVYSGNDQNPTLH